MRALYENDLTIHHNVGSFTISCMLVVGSGEETKQVWTRGRMYSSTKGAHVSRTYQSHGVDFHINLLQVRACGGDQV